MKKTIFVFLALAGTCGLLRAADIGAELPLEDQASVDGWAGIQVRFGEELPAGERVTIVQYYADDDRTGNVEAGEFNFVPLVVKQEDGSLEAGDGQFSIFDIGPTHIPSEGGAQLFPWGGGSVPIPDDGNLYHVGLLEWKNGVNNAAGGLVSFGGEGSGMHFFDVDTSAFAPDDLGDIETGFDLSNDSAQIHTSGPGGRDYQVVFSTSDEDLPPPGDFNVDGAVDLLDFNILTANYNMDVDRGTNGDINYSGHVDFKDFVGFRSAFESGAAAGAAAVPEPVASMLAVLGALSTLHFARRRRRM